ncbi:MAG: universal stress protein [Terriglobales bacterium]
MREQNDSQYFRTVIFATDFSPGVRVAGQYAALLAQHYDVKLVVVHAFELQRPALEAEALGHSPSMERATLDHLLSKTVKELGQFTEDIESALIRGNPSDVIERVSQEQESPLIVVGTHGKGAIERHILGSGAEWILRTLERPVLTVSPHVPMPSSDRLAFRRIVYATDLSSSAAPAACYAFALARSFGSDIDLLHVIPEGSIGQHELLAAREKEFADALNGLIPEQDQAVYTSKTFVEFGNIREHIIEHARERRVDLIVLGVHHHSRLAMHFRTGPAFLVVVEAPCPVLTIRVP